MTTRPRPLTRALLRQWPLPALTPTADKEERGCILVIGGSAQIPGALLLAGKAALRAGAGKLVLATVEAAATALALQMPEARVIALPATPQGGLAAVGLPALEAVARRVDAVVVGPGMVDEAGSVPLVREILRLFAGRPCVLDAAALGVLCGESARERRGGGDGLILTPHAGEMAHLIARDKDDVHNNAAHLARLYAEQWRAVLVLKGACTHIGIPGGQVLRHDSAQVGLATSGSGDVLAGLIGGLAARGLPAAQAAAWGVAVHARSGQRLARAVGPVGFLARELCDEIPAVLQQLL